MAREVSQARRHANRQAWLQTQIRCRELGGGACHDSQSEGSVHRPAGREDHRGELAGAWLDAKRTRVKPSYMDDLEDSWSVWVKPAWGDVPIGMVTRNDVQKWVTDIASQRSASVTLRAYGILAGILDNAVRDGMIHANHARGVELPRKKTKRHVYLTAPQLYSLAGECGWRRDIILTLGLCGMRWGELVPLRVRDVDLDRHRIMVDVSAPMVGGKVTPGDTKTHEGRSIMYPAVLDRIMHDRCEGRRPDDLLFEAPGRPACISRSSARRPAATDGSRPRSGAPASAGT